MIIQYGIEIRLSGRKKYVVLPIMAFTTEYPIKPGRKR